MGRQVDCVELSNTRRQRHTNVFVDVLSTFQNDKMFSRNKKDLSKKITHILRKYVCVHTYLFITYTHIYLFIYRAIYIDRTSAMYQLIREVCEWVIWINIFV